MKCGICECSEFSLLWDLPKLPLTEKYGVYEPNHTLYHDQQLVMCEKCGHVQLAHQMDPNLLYTASEYSFRTGQSNTARLGTEFFYDFFKSVADKRSFTSMLDIGGNDLFLAKMSPFRERTVIDPVCTDSVVDNIRIFGRFIEDIDFKKEKLLPDLIFCRHVLEHISKPKKLLETLFQNCDPGALYVFEIPCFDNLREANRFDAIFHQHYHYFDLSSFQTLLHEAGGKYVTHTHYRQGSNGGSLLIAFTKGFTPRPAVNLQERKRSILADIETYKEQMRLLSLQLQKLSGDLYGYGASLMLATLGYHLGIDFSRFTAILDDDSSKNDLGYKNIPVKIMTPVNIPPNSNFMITSLESARPIFKRIMDFAPRRVLVPLIT